MDELIFRTSQSFENIHIKLNLVSSFTKSLIHGYLEGSKNLAIQIWNNSTFNQIKHNLNSLYAVFLNLLLDIRNTIVCHTNLNRIIFNIMNTFGSKWTKRDFYFVGLGFICGSFIGMFLTVFLRKDNHISSHMQAIRCKSYFGTESVSVVENAEAPYECTENSILIDVQAASLHQIDVEITTGYGHTLRKILGQIFKKMKSDLPATLGRDCTGIITDIGKNVDKRLGIGDEIWLTVPFWDQGTLCQTILISANKVGKKPNNVSFEGACSLPYAGCLALNALKEAGINAQNAQDKRIFINGGCSSVGCVLIQILKYWEADITVACYKRGVPVAEALGCTDIIVLTDNVDKKPLLNSQNSINDIFENTLTKELELRDRFDVIFLTIRDTSLSIKDLRYYCKTTYSNSVVSTYPPPLLSDNFVLISRLLFKTYIYFTYYLEKLFGITLYDFNEFHMCYVNLDELAELVENGHIQTVIEKVFRPQDIKTALSHVQSPEAIGSTIITFR